jgi:threonine/homoserine/homoserine lactone efflux protein
VSVIVLAVLVNIVELLCTAGFPAIYTQILTLHELPWWRYYGFLALYNVAYMLDDALMLAIAVVTLSRHKLQEREGRWLKLVSGVVMVGLGVLLLARPQWLMV